LFTTFNALSTLEVLRRISSAVSCGVLIIFIFYSFFCGAGVIAAICIDVIQYFFDFHVMSCYGVQVAVLNHLVA